MKSKKNKKSHLLRNTLIFFCILIICGGIGCGYLMYTQPLRSAKKFLSNAKALNIEKLQDQLSDADISILEEADLTNPTYVKFFQEVASRISYDLKISSFRINKATIKAQITYPDATEFYKQVIGDFMKQVVLSAFEGTTAQKEDLETQLVNLLMEHVESLDDKFETVTIEIPMVKKEGKWYISGLDGLLPQILTANFQDAIQNLGKEN